MLSTEKKSFIFDLVTLFSSAGTLMCCALPALLVSIGAGGVLLGLTTNIPGLIWLSQHKLAVFAFAGVMLTVGGFARYSSRNMGCPIDLELAKTCGRARRVSGYIYFLSLGFYLIGAFFAFVAPKLL